jgi:xanthine dehydrogenase large subunit
VVKEAYANRIQLWSDGFYRTPKIHYDKATLTGRPFYYFSLRRSLHRGGDRHPDGREPRAEGGHPARRGPQHQPGHRHRPDRRRLCAGHGLAHHRAAGVERQGLLATHAPSTYKIPATGDIPAHFKVDLWPEANREDNVGGSKAVGEPPFMLAISVYEALRARATVHLCS